MKLARRLLPLALSVAAVLLLVGAPGLGQAALAPEGELPRAECYSHHKQQGYRSLDLYPTRLAQVPRGEEFPIEFTVRNPWLHEVRDLYGYVDLSGASGLSFPGEREPVPIDETGAFEASPAGYTVATFAVAAEVNATEILLAVEGPASVFSEPLTGLPFNPRADLDLRIVSPNGRVSLAGPDPGEDLGSPGTTSEELRVDALNLTLGGLGDWTVELAYRGLEQAEFTLTGAVYYNLSRAPRLVLPGPAVLAPGDEHTFRVSVRARDAADLQAIRYGGLGVAYYEHTDGVTIDESPFDKWGTFTTVVGERLEVGTQVARVGEVDTLGPVLRRWGQVVGFASSFLLLPSLVLGGTFGRASVLWSNRLLGSPRRRVLFHNSASFWLLAFALLHLMMFLYESFWNWSHGLVWGGLALACMAGLAVTGATQRRFVAQWGFPRWRFVHFAMGILVVVFTLAHMVADGSHLGVVRAWLGG